jgi:hypothetical protein
MAISGKYGPIDIPGLGADEPVFVVRAQDLLSPAIVEMYKALAESHNAAVADGLTAEIEKFKDWQGLKKLPD